MSNDTTYMREYMYRRRLRRREAAISQLGGKCFKCGTEQDLQFDHIDPSNKLYNVGDLFAGGGEEKLQAELRKCQLLCSPCHLEKSKEEGSLSKGWQKQPRLVHGTRWCYYHHSCRCEECIAAATTKRRLEIEHGTRRGYLCEIRRKTPPCEACKNANKEYTQSLRKAKKPREV